MSTDMIYLRHCPSCGAPMTERSSIKWDEEKKQFQISFSFYCSECSSPDGPTHLEGLYGEFTKELPLRIAEESTCSCGAILKLSDHSIRRTGDEIEVEAIYVCINCSTKKASFSSRIKEGLAKLWRDTTAVEISLDGVKYEKKGGKESKVE